MRLKHYGMQLLNIQEYKNVDFQILPNLLRVKHLQYESLISHQERKECYTGTYLSVMIILNMTGLLVEDRDTETAVSLLNQDSSNLVCSCWGQQGLKQLQRP